MKINLITSTALGLFVVLSASSHASLTDLDQNPLQARVTPTGSIKRDRADTNDLELARLADDVIIASSPKKPAFGEQRNPVNRKAPKSLLRDPLKIKPVAGKKKVSFENKLKVVNFTNKVGRYTDGSWDYQKSLMKKTGPNLDAIRQQSEVEAIRKSQIIIPEQVMNNPDMKTFAQLGSSGKEGALRHQALLNDLNGRATKAKALRDKHNKELARKMNNHDDYWNSKSTDLENEAKNLAQEVFKDDLPNNGKLDKQRYRVGKKYAEAAAALQAGFGTLKTVIEQDGSQVIKDREYNLDTHPKMMERYCALLEKSILYQLKTSKRATSDIFHAATDFFFRSAVVLIQAQQKNPNWRKSLAYCRDMLEHNRSGMENKIRNHLRHDVDSEQDGCDSCHELLHRQEMVFELLSNMEKKLQDGK